MSFAYLRQVERFVAVADEGSIQAAARRLNLSQPSLTKAIQAIEESFGTRLFERTRHGMRLTATGRLLYDRSKIILREGGMAREQIGDLVTGRSGLLRIVAGTAWGYCLMPAIIVDLQERFPDLDIEIGINVTREALPELLAGSIDVVVGSLEDDDGMVTDGIVREEVMPIHYAAACGADNPLAGRHGVSLAELANAPLIIYQDDRHLISKVMTSLDAARPGGLHIAVRTSSLLIALELIRGGDYVVCLAEPFLRKFRSWDIRVLDLATPLASFRSGVFYRDSLGATEPFTYLLGRIRRAGRLASATTARPSR